MVGKDRSDSLLSPSWQKKPEGKDTFSSSLPKAFLSRGWEINKESVFASERRKIKNQLSGWFLPIVKSRVAVGSFYYWSFYLSLACLFLYGTLSSFLFLMVSSCLLLMVLPCSHILVPLGKRHGWVVKDNQSVSKQKKPMTHQQERQACDSKMKSGA